MSEQIDLGELRTKVDHSEQACHGECVIGIESEITRGDVLALIEAVEAADHLLAVFEWDPDDEPEARALNAALRRFTGWKEPA